MFNTPSSEKASISEMDTQHTPNPDIDSLKDNTLEVLIQAYYSVDLFHRRKHSYYLALGRQLFVVNLFHPDTTEKALNTIEKAIVFSLDYCQMPNELVLCREYYSAVLQRMIDQSRKTKIQFDAIMKDLDDIILPVLPTEEVVNTFLLHRLESDLYPRLGEPSLRRTANLL